MEWDSKTWTKIGAIATLFSCVIGIGLTVYFNRDKSTIIEIRKMNAVELTRPLDVARLSSTYMYDDSIPVEHLWQSSYLLKNVGEKTIFGPGFEQRNIRGNAIKLHIEDCNQLLSLEIVDTNTDGCLRGDSLVVYQWRSGEYVELQLVSDGPNAPILLVSDRDIQDVKIVKTAYSPEEKVVSQRFVDRFSQSFSKTLWWIVIVFECFLFIVLSAAGIKQFRTTPDRITKISTAIVWIVVLFLMFAPLFWMF